MTHQNFILFLHFADNQHKRTRGSDQISLPKVAKQ